MSNFSYEPSIYDGKHTVVEQLEMTKAYLKGVEGMLKEGPTVAQLETKIDGSETVIVDVNEAGTALEVHLDEEVVEKIDRAILQPVDAVSEDSVAVITPTRDVNYVPVSELGGGSGGSGASYAHRIFIFDMDYNYTISGILVSTRSTPYTIDDLIASGEAGMAITNLTLESIPGFAYATGTIVSFTKSSLDNNYYMTVYLTGCADFPEENTAQDAKFMVFSLQVDDISDNVNAMP